MNKNLSIMLIAFVLSLGTLSAADKMKTEVKAPEVMADNTQLIIDKIKADKKLVVANNMALTESEAKNFWPLYDSYQKDLEKINQRIGKTITSYGESYTTNSMTDEKAKSLISEVLSIEESELALRKSYAEKLGKVLPQTKVAKYLQIENKIRTMIKSELADGIPLVP